MVDQNPLEENEQDSSVPTSSVPTDSNEASCDNNIVESVVTRRRSQRSVMQRTDYVERSDDDQSDNE